MPRGFKKNEFTDPGDYDKVIRKQKKYARKHPADAEAWLALGRLCEAKIELTNKILNKSCFERIFLPISVITYSAALFGVAYVSKGIESYSLAMNLLRGAMLLVVMVLALWTFFIRYPRSGRRYFQKALQLDFQCGEAHLFLGLIALRRHQKRTAIRLWEEALMLGVKNEDIEKKLSFLYEKVFFQFFQKETLRKNKKDDLIKDQALEIKELIVRNNALKKRVEALSSKIKQTKWEANQHIKSQEKEASHRVENIQQDYEAQILKLTREKQQQKEREEIAERNRVRLTTEILEAKAELETSSFEMATKKVEASMEKVNWQALSSESKSYLATAEQVASMLNVEEDSVDYGLVGMELCKALERELNRFLIQPFVEQLNGNKKEFLRINKMGEKSGKPVYFSYLAKLVDQENFSGKTTLTLGQCHFVLQKALKGEYALELYRNFLDNNATPRVLGHDFVKKLNTVVNRYRNTIAHQSRMNKKEYMALRKLIFAGRRALLKTVLDCHSEKNCFEKRANTVGVMPLNERFHRGVAGAYQNEPLEAPDF